jgi:hypothetical protein
VEFKSLTLRSQQDKDVCLLSIFLFNIILEFSSNAIRQEKEMRHVTYWEGKVKLSFSTDDKIAYEENLKESTEILLELRIIDSKVLR